MRASLVRRLGRLEADRPSKLTSVDSIVQHAISQVSDEDLDALEQMATLQQDGKEREITSQQHAALRRYAEIHEAVSSQTGGDHRLMVTLR
jgi:hypothetical protein